MQRQGGGGEWSGQVPAGDEGSGRVEKPAVMPGILKRREDGQSSMEGKGAPNDRGSTSPACTGTVTRPPSDLGDGFSLLNGVQPLTNGFHAEDTPTELNAADDRSTQDSLALMERRLPPEIEHITFGYLPLANLITRLVQDTFNGLNDALGDVWDMKGLKGNDNPPHIGQRPLVNGEVAARSSESNVQRKLRMLHFTQDNRARFIKILVLSKWSRQVESIGKVIDLKVWLDGQARFFEDAISWMGELKRILPPMKQPSPDLKTALEVLSLGKASWLSDANYLPSQKLAPQEILKGLKRINTLLTIRLRLHEDIPRSLRNFSIASGRATFRVQDEFEIDITIADEDLSSQLYLVDFRFAFSPASSELAPGPLKEGLREHIDKSLKEEGLKASYDFLHEFVLTHKINILKRQAFEMSNAQWSGSIKVEGIHRSLVVQYWINKPGPKNWIEIGVQKGAHTVGTDGLSERKSTLGLRWFRQGKEVKDTSVDLDVGNISMSKILKQILASHTNFVFRIAKEKIQSSPLYAQRLFRIKHKARSKDSTGCSFLIQLTPSKAVKILQEPITGKFALLPPTDLHSWIEGQINELPDPGTEMASRISNLRCLASLHEYTDLATSLGFESEVPVRLDKNIVIRHFGREANRIRFFRRKPWSTKWFLALSTSMGGDSWWIVDVKPDKRDATKPHNSLINETWKINLDGCQDTVPSPTPEALMRVEKLAAEMITQQVDVRYLKEKNILYELRNSPSPAKLPRMCMHIAPDAAPALIGLQKPSTRWREDILSPEVHLLDPQSHLATYICRARLRFPMSNAREYLKQLPTSILFKANSRDFMFFFQAPIGSSTVPQLLRELFKYERLLNLLNGVQRCNLAIRSIDVRGLGFVYATEPTPLQACIRIPSGFRDPEFRLLPPNPQIRIQSHLGMMFRSAPPHRALAGILHLLRYTLPMARVLNEIENLHAEAGSFVKVSSLAADQLRIDYRSPRIVLNFALRQRRDLTAWHIRYQIDKTKDEEPKSQSLIDALLEVMRQRNEKWKGMKGSVVATLDGIEDLVLRLDEVIRINSQPPATVTEINGHDGAPDEPVHSPSASADGNNNNNNLRKRKAEDDGQRQSSNVPPAQATMNNNKTPKTTQGQSPSMRQPAGARVSNAPPPNHNRASTPRLPQQSTNGPTPNKPPSSSSVLPQKRKAEDEVVVLD